MKNIISNDTYYIPYQPGFEQKVHYQNYIVCKGHPLYGIVSDFYQFESDSITENKICVIPDGCIDILFRYSNGHMNKTLEGFHREKLILPIMEDGCAFGIRFFPGAIAEILNIYAQEVIAKQIPLTDILGHDSLPDKMEEAVSFKERIEIMTHFLLNKNKKNYGSADIVKYCTKKIIQAHGNISMTNLAEETGYSLRYLRELYYKYVGISPKELSEIIQFQSSFVRLTHIQKTTPGWSLSDFAIESGYYDQSHMNKSYQKIVGCKPTKLYQELYGKVLT